MHFICIQCAKYMFFSNCFTLDGVSLYSRVGGYFLDALILPFFKQLLVLMLLLTNLNLQSLFDDCQLDLRAEYITQALITSTTNFEELFYFFEHKFVSILLFFYKYQKLSSDTRSSKFVLYLCSKLSSNFTRCVEKVLISNHFQMHIKLPTSYNWTLRLFYDHLTREDF